ncbi:MAG: TIGR01841 family phasin [Gammaproteobacteria bacterium]|nr:TIGR01841 family phasin [Gammaproteobacteria bacterium]
MQDQIIEDISAATKTSYEALQELGRINSETVSKLTQLQFNMASLGIEGSVEQARLLTSTTNYQELLTAESDFASNYSDKIMSIARQTADVLSESRDEVTAWLEKSASSVAKATQSPAKKPAAKKPAARKSTAKKSATAKA